MARVDPNRTVYIYGLCTEDDETIMYVGCSVNPEQRRTMHVSFAKQGWAPMTVGPWLLSCVGQKRMVIAKVLDSCLASEAPQVEAKWIEKIRSVNHGLLNAKRYSPYTPHVDAKAALRNLQPATDIAPGDDVIHMRTAYWVHDDERGRYDPTPAKVLRIGRDRILIDADMGDYRKEYWAPRHRLYHPPTQGTNP